MDVRLHALPAAFDLPEWRELVAADEHRHIFATPEWARLWWGAFGDLQSDGFALTFHDAGESSAAVGLMVLTVDDASGARRLRLLGGDDLTDYQGPVIAGAEHRPQVAEAFLRYLLDDFAGWDYLEAKGMPVPFHFSEWLVEAADRMEVPFELELHELTAVLGLPPTWDAYLESLPKKKKHELERKQRRFDREAPRAVLRSADEASLEKDLDSFMRLHRSSEGEKGEFMRPARERFFRDVAGALQPEGMLSLDLLELEGDPISMTISFEYDGVFYLYNSAYSSELRRISPGLILVARLIERSIGRGLRRFDFLRGRERYKYDLGAEALPLNWILIRRPGYTGPVRDAATE